MNKQKKFCPNCGHPVAANAHFCGNCGFDLTKVRAPKTRTEKTTAPAPKHQPQHTLPKWAAWLLGIVAVLLIGGYLFGSSYYAPEKQLDRALTALQKDDAHAARYFSSSDPNLKITQKSLAPLVTYMQHHKQELAALKTQLSSPSATSLDGDFHFKQTGRHWLVFKKYQINVKAVYPKITTNRDNTKVYMNGKKLYQASGKTTKKIGPFVPGTYQLKATAQVKKQRLSNSGTYHITTQNRNFSLPIKTISFEVLGYPGAEVRINGKKQGTISKQGELNLVDIPWSSEMILTQVYKSSAGKITSKPRKINETDANSSLKVAYPGVISHADASVMVENIFDGVDEVSSTGQLPSQVDYDGNKLSNYFVGGAGNDHYTELVEMAKGYYKDDTISSVSYDTVVKHVYPHKRNQATVVYNVTFTFDNLSDDGDDTGQHIQVFEYQATVEKVGSHYKIKTIAPSTKVSDKHIDPAEDDDEDEDDLDMDEEE